MCGGCLLEALEDGPVELSSGHFVAMSYIRRIYETEWGSNGGPLHVVIDDDNVDDEYVTPEFVSKMVWQWLAWCDGPFTDDDYRLVLDTAAALYALPEPDRVVAVELAHDRAHPITVGTILTREDYEIVLSSRYPRVR